MRKVIRFLGLGAAGVGVMLCLVGLLLLPERNGLFFAMPFVFLFPGLAFALIGGLGVLLTRNSTSSRKNK